MKKKLNTKPTDQDLKDWNSFINNISNIEDKDARIDKVLKNNQRENLFDIRKDLHGFKMYEALEDFYMFGFNIQNKDEDWNGRLLKDEEVKVENESVIICLDGNPFINNKRLIQFDYADLSTDKVYDVELNEGVVALFTKV